MQIARYTHQYQLVSAQVEFCVQFYVVLYFILYHTLRQNELSNAHIRHSKIWIKMILSRTWSYLVSKTLVSDLQTSSTWQEKLFIENTHNVGR